VDEAYQIIVITFSAIFGIVVLKLILARFPIPGLRDIVAMA
jgi:hypothetical protein